MCPSTVRKEQLRRFALIQKLGGVCQDGFCFETRGLEFDHPEGRDWSPRQLSRLQRQSRYEADADKGLLRLLCREHNAKDGCRRKYGQPLEILEEAQT